MAELSVEDQERFAHAIKTSSFLSSDFAEALEVLRSKKVPDEDLDDLIVCIVDTTRATGKCPVDTARMFGEALYPEEELVADLTWSLLLRRMHTAGYRLIRSGEDYWSPAIQDEAEISYAIVPRETPYRVYSVGGVYRTTFSGWIVQVYGVVDRTRWEATLYRPTPGRVLDAAQRCGLLTEEATHDEDFTYVELTADEERAMAEREAQRELGISFEEFKRRWARGDYPDCGTHTGAWRVAFNLTEAERRGTDA